MMSYPSCMFPVIPEIISLLLEMFNMLDDEEQVQRLCSLSGYLLGRKILSEDDSMKYLREIKKD